VFVDRPAPTYSYRGLWRELLLASMLLLLTSVALRRLMMPREAIEAMGRLVPASVRARFARRPRSVATTGPSAIDALAASARERRAAREPAAEVIAAQRAQGEIKEVAPSSPWTGTPEPKPPAAPVEAPRPEAPRSLAENLVARRKNKK